MNNNMDKVEKTLTSGRKVTVNYDEDGEPVSVDVSLDGVGHGVILGENEIYDLVAIIEDDDDKE